ncbi:MAG TPA: prepilin-type N-terminal cleavage/methylation domain-containing protein [Dongiaceae bacterium]|nr:prepilin-type N-terminal cleavage/methylation domain-containing protein [Dongiaceae bacterium]
MRPTLQIAPCSIAAPKWVRRTLRQRGFTMIEVMIVIAIILILVGIGVGMYQRSIQGARESVLKEDLQTMRQAIDNYTLDKQQAPQSIQDLVDGHYLRAVPVDPVCRLDWTLHFSDQVISPDQSGSGIDDVHSSCDGTGVSDPSPYNTW